MATAMMLSEPFAAIASLKGNRNLLPVYAAVLKQIRRSMDDWIPIPNLHAFVSLLNSFGLSVIVDCIFEELADNKAVDGTELSPTTRARALMAEMVAFAEPGSTVHVFISAKKEWAEAALAAGWYSVAVPGERLLLKPWKDASRLGEAFGYPPCCVTAFGNLNEWSLRSHLSEVMRLSEALSWKANCLTMRTQYMAICHIPCRFDCPRTVSLTSDILLAVRELDQEYAARIEYAMKGVFLIVNEAAVFKLHGAEVLNGTQVRFSRAEDLFQSRIQSNEHTKEVLKIMQDATWLNVEEGVLHIKSEALNSHSYIEPGVHTAWCEDPRIAIF